MKAARSAAFAAVLLLATWLPFATHAAAPEKTLGAREYENKCARCHGTAGKGDGWFTEFMKKPPPSLTRLSRDNAGVFPFDRVYQVIDGRKAVPAHGSREMPVWGDVYRSGTIRYHHHGIMSFDEGEVRATILALVEHIARLQE